MPSDPMTDAEFTEYLTWNHVTDYFADDGLSAIKGLRAEVELLREENRTLRHTSVEVLDKCKTLQHHLAGGHRPIPDDISIENCASILAFNGLIDVVDDAVKFLTGST